MSNQESLELPTDDATEACASAISALAKPLTLEQLEHEIAKLDQFRGDPLVAHTIADLIKIRDSIRTPPPALQ